jgi:hypothetical protein
MLVGQAENQSGLQARGKINLPALLPAEAGINLFFTVIKTALWNPLAQVCDLCG